MGEINTLCTLNDVYELALICQYTIFEAVLKYYIYIYIYIYIYFFDLACSSKIWRVEANQAFRMGKIL